MGGQLASFEGRLMLSAELSRRFQEVLAAYLEAREKGQSVDPQALLRAHPELAKDLQEFFANERRFASAAAGLAATGPQLTRAVIGDYEILGEIARGGMGVVYRARHTQLQRLVALKMLLGGAFAGREGLRRFRTEAEVVAALDHPNIVPIYDIGTHEEQAYFCMKLIDGPSLKQQIAWYVGKPEPSARLIISIARAVHHAHQRGILHRDLKPGNILLQPVEPRAPGNRPTARAGKKGKQYPVSGIPASAAGNLHLAVPFVTDFGLAKRFESDGAASHSTAVVGTAAYMAPEQATSRGALTVAADVYGLGAILYELLTGRAPFIGQNQLEILLQVAEKHPPSPLELRPSLNPDLARICLKCLRKQPAERYVSAEALAVELEQWLAGEPLTVRAPTRMEQLWRGCRRHPIAVFLAMLVGLAVVGSSGLNLHLNDLNEQLRQAMENSEGSEKLARERARDAGIAAERERLARIDAEKAKADLLASLAKQKAASAAEAKARAAEMRAFKESRHLLVLHYVSNGQQLLERNDLYGAAVWFAEALEQDPRDPMQRIRLGTTLRQVPPLMQTWFFDEKIRLLRLHPTGDRLLTVDKENSAALWDAKTGRQIGEPLQHDGAIHAAEFSPNGQWLVTAGADGVARLYNAGNGTPHRGPLKHAKNITAAAFSGDGKWLATASADRTARLWDVAAGKSVGEPLAHDQEVSLVAFHPDGKKLLTVSENVENKQGEMRVWELNAGRKFRSWKAAPGLRAAGFSRDGKQIYAVSNGSKIYLWDFATGNPTKLPAGLKIKGDPSAWFAPALDRFVQAGETDVKVIELPKGTPTCTLSQSNAVSLAQFSPSGRFVVTASASAGVQLWRPDNGQALGAPLPHPQTVIAVQVSGDEKWLVTLTEERVVRLWSLAWPDKDQVVAIPKSRGTPLAVSPDGNKVLLAQAKAIAVFAIGQGRTVGASLPFAGVVLHACWSADGKMVAVATREEVRIWDTADNKSATLALKYEKNEKPATSLEVQFSVDGKELAVWGKAQFWRADLQGNPLAWAWAGATKQVHVLDYDGSRLALWKRKGTLEIQDLTSARAKPLQKLAVMPEWFRFSPNGVTGAAGFADGSLRIWDLVEGKPITLPFSGGEPIRQIVYSVDGRFLATAGASGRCRVWDASTGQQLSPAFAPAAALVDLTFRSDSGVLLGLTTDGQLHHWNLEPIEGDAKEIARQVRRSAGQQLDAGSGGLILLDLATLRQLCQ
jgi:WD40 repeat protein/serine/threonine protein kinase